MPDMYTFGASKVHFIILVVQPKRCTVSQIIYSFKNAVHVSDGLSVHHQELKTAYMATGIRQTAAATCCYQGRDGMSSISQVAAAI